MHALSKSVRSGALCCALIALSAAPALAQTPARTPTGATLVVPDDHAALGTVYFVSAGPDVQVTFTSDAPVERVVGASSAVVGYAVVAENPGSAESPLLAGAFRLPVASFETGIPLRNEHLRSARWMDAAAHPDVHFRLDAFENATIVKQDAEQGFTTWQGDLVGEMTIKGASRTVAVPARVSLIDLGDNRQVRGGGLKLAIRCQYTVNLSDYGVATNEQIIGTRMSDEIRLDQFLLLSPDDPEAGVRGNADIRRFMTLLVRERDADAAYAMAPGLVEASWDNAQALNTIANIVTSDQAARQDMRLAFKCANRAAELTNESNAMILDTVAGLHFKAGDLESAIAWQKKAVGALNDQIPAGMQRVIRANLQKYEAESGA
jgi:polyisoprenoid-binding protein YceI